MERSLSCMEIALLQILGRQLERAKGIEPSYAAWEAAVLPLNYARERLPRSGIFARRGNSAERGPRCGCGIRPNEVGLFNVRLFADAARSVRRLKQAGCVPGFHS